VKYIVDHNQIVFHSFVQFCLDLMIEKQVIHLIVQKELKEEQSKHHFRILIVVLT
jgi:hypothetical protein